MWLDKGDDLGQGPTDAKTSQWNMHPNNESPWAKPVRPGRNDDDRVLLVELLAKPEENYGGSQGQPQIRRELFRTPLARLPRLDRGC